jgi:Sap, sulfolipid-1-addressing protein
MANVSTADAVVSAVVFALTSIVTIAAPVVVVLVARERSAAVLANWKAWMLTNSRSIGLIALMVIGTSWSPAASTSWRRRQGLMMLRAGRSRVIPTG